MPVSTEAVGKRFPPVVYAVGREKVKEYAFAVGETDPLHLDVQAARAAGHHERAGNGFYVFETRSTNQDGETVCVGTWTNIVRGG